MHSSTHKRVLLRHRQQGWLAAFLDVALDISAQAPDQPLALLSQSGQLLAIAHADILAVFFVSDFACAPELRPSATVRRTPRQPGLWVRAKLCDHQSVEGILASDLLELDQGLTLTPLYAATNWQRLWVPAHALVALTPVDMVKAPRRRTPVADLLAHQTELFADPDLFEVEENPQ